MQAIEKILVDIDPDKDEQPALTKALIIAQHQPTTIMLLSCIYYPSVVANNLLTPSQLEKTKSAIIRKHQLKLDRLVAKNHSHENITFETLVIWHSPIYHGILQVVENFRTDLVVKATHQHNALVKRLFTPTDWYLLKACPVPLLLVKTLAWTEKTSIVATVDPEHKLSQQSELDKNVLQGAFNMSSTLNMPLHAVHCFDPSYWTILFEAMGESGAWTDVFSVDEQHNESMVLEQLRYQHNLKFAEACSEYVPNSANQHILSGEIEHVLPSTLTSLHAGIAVMGTTYRTGLLGSTAQKLVETVECDLLAIKPKDFEAPFH